MTKEELAHQLDGIVAKKPKSDWSKYQRNIVDKAIEMLKQESNEDCVSRQALYESLYEHFHDNDNPSNITEVTLGSVRNFVKNFPSATPMRKRGKWVANHDESDDSHSIDCSCCNYTLVIVVNRGYTAEQALDCVKDMTKNYCPNCGAEMECEE